MATYTKAELVEMVKRAAREINFDERIAVAQIQQESSFNPNARSPYASGLTQFIPATARRFGVTNIFDPKQAIMAWQKYMTFLMKRYRGNYKLALAAYNAGEGAVDKYKGIPPFKETRNYVAKIMANAGKAGASFANSVSQTAGEVIKSDNLPKVALFAVFAVVAFIALKN